MVPAAPRRQPPRRRRPLPYLRQVALQRGADSPTPRVDEEDHPNLVGPDAAPCGHGVLLWFEVDDFDAAVRRVRSLRAKVLLKPHVNPAPGHREIWLRDPDG